jgi:hypothetical protein
MTRGERTVLAAELSDLFDRTVAAYFWALDHEEWTALWECTEIIGEIHRLQEAAPIDQR